MTSVVITKRKMMGYDLMEALMDYAWMVVASLSGGVIAINTDGVKMKRIEVLKYLGMSIVAGVMIGPAVAAIFSKWIGGESEVRTMMVLICAFGAKHIFDGIRRFMKLFSRDPAAAIRSVFWGGSSNEKDKDD